MERTSILSLEEILNVSIEAISLIIILLDFNLFEIFKQKGISESDLSAFDFEGLVSTAKGHEFLRFLIDAIVKRHIDQQLQVCIILVGE
jgi:hypothetical protein